MNCQKFKSRNILSFFEQGKLQNPTTYYFLSDYVDSNLLFQRCNKCSNANEKSPTPVRK